MDAREGLPEEEVEGGVEIIGSDDPSEYEMAPREAAAGGSAEAAPKKKRGRPPKPQGQEGAGGSAKSSGRKGKGQQAGSGYDGTSFRPHLITVDTGEDIGRKVITICQEGPRVICILSAVGAISNVALRQDSSGAITTYEGLFQILSFSGCFMPLGDKSWSGGMSVSLAGADGRVIGGGINGLLTAAGPVQVVVCSFLPNDQKGKGKNTMPPPPPPPTDTVARPPPTSTTAEPEVGVPGHRHQITSGLGWLSMQDPKS
ncbi:hypothetical protein M0R45_034683 [Rubus argutus]|uniref:AT-hook motif nuclear-localized protein n=1 Tax=Rubus argutus TaxID=59490 RepID=A0AAW1VV07_RUBAR